MKHAYYVFDNVSKTHYPLVFFSTDEEARRWFTLCCTKGDFVDIKNDLVLYFAFNYDPEYNLVTDNSLTIVLEGKDIA